MPCEPCRRLRAEEITSIIDTLLSTPKPCIPSAKPGQLGDAAPRFAPLYSLPREFSVGSGFETKDPEVLAMLGPWAPPPAWPRGRCRQRLARWEQGQPTPRRGALRPFPRESLPAFWCFSKPRAANPDTPGKSQQTPGDVHRANFFSG